MRNIQSDDKNDTNALVALSGSVCFHLRPSHYLTGLYLIIWILILVSIYILPCAIRPYFAITLKIILVFIITGFFLKLIKQYALLKSPRSVVMLWKERRSLMDSFKQSPLKVGLQPGRWGCIHRNGATAIGSLNSAYYHGKRFILITLRLKTYRQTLLIACDALSAYEYRTLSALLRQ